MANSPANTASDSGRSPDLDPLRNAKVQNGTAANSDTNLCATCRLSTIVRGRSLDEEIVQNGIDFNNLTGMTNDPRQIGLEFVARF